MPITPAQAALILGNLPIGETLASALDAAAERLANAVRSGLTGTPGSSHVMPWDETGRLEDSIQHSSDGLNAVIGSDDPAAAPQELGTMHVAPRPFLAPAAAALSEEIVQEIGATLAALLAGHIQ